MDRAPPTDCRPSRCRSPGASWRFPRVAHTLVQRETAGKEASPSNARLNYDTGMHESLQDRYAPHNRCFGCGPSNPKGLRIKSFVEGEEVVCAWHPEEHHEAFPGMLNGGIC